MRLSWHPVSYWIPRDWWRRAMFYTRGMNLSDPIFERETVWAGVGIQWVTVVGTVIGAGSVGSIVECRFTEIGQGVCAAAARADFGFVHGLDDFCGAKLLDSTWPEKGKMLQVKFLDDTEGTRFARSALAGKVELLLWFLGNSYRTGFTPTFMGDNPTSKSMGYAL